MSMAAAPVVLVVMEAVRDHHRWEVAISFLLHLVVLVVVAGQAAAAEREVE